MGAHLNLFQKQVGLHKAVAHEATGCPAVLQEAGRVGAYFGVSAHQLAVMGHQGFGDLQETAPCQRKGGGWVARKKGLGRKRQAGAGHLPCQGCAGQPPEEGAH